MTWRDALKTSSEVRKWIFMASIGLAISFGASLVVGPCRPKQKAPEPPPVIPGHVDQGENALPPVVPAPEVQTVYVPVPAAPLTPEQIVDEAKKLGMVYLTAEQIEAGEKVENAVDPLNFHLFAQEDFGPGPAGDWIKVSALQNGPGMAIDLVGAWRDYQPPTPAPAATCASDDGIVGNRAEWHFVGGPAAMVTKEGVGVGPMLHASYDGFYLWKLRSSFEASAGWSDKTGPVVTALAGVGF